MRVVIVGGGAAGVMAAIFAAEGGAATTLLERTADGGRKILISGGGRCNILPVDLDESRFVTDSSRHTLKRILRSWPLREQIRFFQEQSGIALAPEPPGKMFPVSGSAREVRDKLFRQAAGSGVLIQYNVCVSSLAPAKEGWRIELAGGDNVECDRVILAAGGLSVPSTGSDGSGLSMAAALGHTIGQTYPALTPLLGGLQDHASLSGVSLPVSITARGGGVIARSSGGFLFTHRGYSGPAVLDVSHVVSRTRDLNAETPRLTVAWSSLDEDEWEDALKPAGTRTLLGAVSQYLPARLAAALLLKAAVDPRTPLANFTREDRRRTIDTLMRGDLPCTGDEGYKKAEVTGGGVSLDEINPLTMESRRHSGLYLCGEMLDAFGPIGGYNFFWAWATGRAAGKAAARR